MAEILGRREKSGANKTSCEGRPTASAAAQPDQRDSLEGCKRNAGTADGRAEAADGGSRQGVERRGINGALFYMAKMFRLLTGENRKMPAGHEPACCLDLYGRADSSSCQWRGGVVE